MAQIELTRSSPEESRRWAQYLERRRETLLADPKLRTGIRLAILPSFTALRCWTVEYRPQRSVAGESASGRAVRSVCEVEGEYERFREAAAEAQALLVPNVVRTTHEVPPAFIEELEEILDAVTVPLSIVGAPFGTDGVTHLLERDHGFHRVRVEWWANGPNNWSSLRSGFESAWAKLEQLAEGGR